MLPKGFEEIPDRPGAVGVRAGGPIMWLLGGLGVVLVLGGIPLFFVKAKESARMDSLWPIGLGSVVLGLFCLGMLYVVTRRPKYVFDEVGVHSSAVFGRNSVHWEHVEKVAPVRGGVWVTAPGGIHNKSGKLTRKKTLQINTQGLRCSGRDFVAHLNARVLSGGKPPPS